MGIQCRIIKNKQGQVQYVEAPNGNRSQLYDDAKSIVGENDALDIVLTAYTPSFIEEVKNPKIADFRRQLVDRINNIQSDSQVVTINLDEIDYNLNPSNLEMTTEDLGNGETLINFTTELDSIPVEPTPTQDNTIPPTNILQEIINRLENSGLSEEVNILSEKDFIDKLNTLGNKRLNVENILEEAIREGKIIEEC